MGRPESVEGVADLNELEKLPNGSRKFSLRPTFNRLIRLLAEDAGVDEHEFRLNFPMNFHSLYQTFAQLAELLYLSLKS
jgi:hypothetical protein